jgi:hypothetical protein
VPGGQPGNPAYLIGGPGQHHHIRGVSFKGGIVLIDQNIFRLVEDVLGTNNIYQFPDQCVVVHP